MIAARQHLRWGTADADARLLRLESALGISACGRRSPSFAVDQPVTTGTRVQESPVTHSRHPIIQAAVDICAVLFGAFLLCLFAAAVGIVLAVLYLSLRS